MIRSTPMYVTRVQRNIGVMTLRPVRQMRRKYPPPIKIYRQDYQGKQAARKIQAAWRKFRLWKFSYNPVYPRYISHVDGSHFHGYHPNLCATKLQAVFRGHRARLELPKRRMVKWLVDNLL